jgi:hypothetical protein
MNDSSIVVLNSKFRTADSNSSSNFTISIGQSVSIKQIVVKSVSMPNSFYNINSSNNVAFVNLIGLGTYVIIVPVGQYNLANFLIALQTLLTGIDLGATVVQNPVTLKLDFTFSWPAQFSTQSNSPLSKVLGTYTTNTGDPTAYPVIPATSFSANALTDLSGVRNVYICSRVLGQGVNSILQSGDNLPMILNMPVTEPFGAVVYFESNETVLTLKSYKQTQNLQFIDLTLRGENSEVLDINGSEWSVTLLVYYNKIIT